MSAPPATITTAPLIRRAVTTIGYISTNEYDGTTFWDTITANDQGNIIATSDNLFQICDVSKPCTFFTCSSDWVVFATTSLFCGGSSSTCSYWELATDINDKNPLTNYWCDAKTSVGGIIYMKTPEAVSASTTRTGSSVSSATGTSKSSIAPVTVSFTSASVIASERVTSISSLGPGLDQTNGKNDSKGKSTPVGAIAGGVVGGVVVLGAIIFGVWFWLRRKKHNQTNNANITQPTQQTSLPPSQMQQQSPQQPPAGVQYYHEQKPVPQPQVQQVPPPAPAPALAPAQQPYGHYDPNAHSTYVQQSQGSYSMSPDQTTTSVTTAQHHQTHSYYAESGSISPVPQYSPSPSPAVPPVPPNMNELSSERM
ncbi:uncharacterized protein SETTUDRAFT_163031 [Exserohilum turcica Et28A]|uniref:Uncharacterized protein n=1 Tax=Exserohilum turcicum (strain 28A) TaxID=671987 RepID=R0K177_EXST2|nr:uncharacterized protein SETTUDRAFT_163031 [Exserohilum turcica Et28A]EOA86913.1 hypothetical protein SETTUDRAFT_163031 [Exserohilum turcica Et28A]